MPYIDNNGKVLEQGVWGSDSLEHLSDKDKLLILGYIDFYTSPKGFIYAQALKNELVKQMGLREEK